MKQPFNFSCYWESRFTLKRISLRIEGEISLFSPETEGIPVEGGQNEIVWRKQTLNGRYCDRYGPASSQESAFQFSVYNIERIVEKLDTGIPS